MSSLLASSVVRQRGAPALNAGVIIAGLYYGRELIVPLVLAMLLAFVLAPLVSLLRRARLGHVLSVLLAVTVAFAIIGGIGLLVVEQGAGLAVNLAEYGSAIQRKLHGLPIGGDMADQAAAAIHGMLHGGQRSLAGADTSTTMLGVVRSVGEALLGPLSTAGVVAVFVIVVLLAKEDLRDRLVRLVGRQDLHRTILAMNDAAHRLSRYYLLQLAINSAFAVFIGTGLWLAGLPGFILWGVLAGLMRFVPFIGTFIAGTPALILAMAIAPGWGLPLLVFLLFAITDLMVGQVFEPLLYGHSTGLSPVAVVLSAAFWAFLWGPVGLLIAVPLTVCLVVVGRHVEPLAFLEVAFGDRPPLDPPETFYQRALEGNERELRLQADRVIALTSPAGYYDSVALPGLALAQADLSRDDLAFERLEQVHARIERLLAGFTVTPPANATGWSAPGSVLCMPGRGPLDDLAATMAMQALLAEGFGAVCESNLVLGSGPVPARDFSPVRLCCLSIMEEGSGLSAVQYLTRRIQRQMPAATVVVGLWNAAGDSRLLAALRAQDDQNTIVLSVGELTAMVRAVSTRRVPASSQTV